MEKILQNVKERENFQQLLVSIFTRLVLKKIKKTCLKKIKGRIQLQIYVCEFICLFCCVALFHKEQLLAFFNYSRFAVLRGVHNLQRFCVVECGKAGI